MPIATSPLPSTIAYLDRSGCDCGMGYGNLCCGATEYRFRLARRTPARQSVRAVVFAIVRLEDGADGNRIVGYYADAFGTPIASQVKKDFQRLGFSTESDAASTHEFRDVPDEFVNYHLLWMRRLLVSGGALNGQRDAQFMPVTETWH